MHYDFSRAFAAVRKLSADPDDTTQVFEIIESLSGDTDARILRGYERDAVGRTMLAERPQLLPRLIDRAALERLPSESLGRAYLTFIDAEGITPDGLEAAAEQAQVVLSDGSAQAYVGERMRVTHDLWHTVTGYRGDVVGEVSLLAFNLAQIWNYGIAAIVLTGLTRVRELDLARVMIGGYQRGTHAAWLPSVPWEKLLHVPLDDVRSKLRIDAPPVYRVRRTTELRAEGVLPTKQASIA